MPGVAGGTAWKFRLEKQLRTQADQICHRLRKALERECAAHNSPFEWPSFEGDPIKTLYMAAETRDLIISGHDTAFHGNIRDQLPEMIFAAIIDNASPCDRVPR